MNPENKPVEKPPTETPAATTPTLTTPKKRSGWLPVFVLLGVFLVGFVPMWFKATRLNGELFRAQQQARMQTIQITFADAALDARRGDYEPARQRMANFFTLVNTEQNRGIGSALPASASEGLKPLLAQRDDLITLLARGDQASAERLATAYGEFRKSLGK
jgi:hypothetical protein